MRSTRALMKTFRFGARSRLEATRKPLSAKKIGMMLRTIGVQIVPRTSASPAWTPYDTVIECQAITAAARTIRR